MHQVDEDDDDGDDYRLVECSTSAYKSCSWHSSVVK